MDASSLIKRSNNRNLMDIMEAVANEISTDEPFYVANLEDVVKKYRLWKTNLPRVNPYYAVKTNSDIAMLRLFVSLGLGFDCASKEEMAMALAAGAKASDIIYAHPYKFHNHLQYAKCNNINLLTFDSEEELLKIKKIHPESKLLIRFRVPDVKADVPLNNKFGCEFEECYHLLQVANQLGLEVIGTCFHVGGLCNEPMAYSRAIKIARDVFDMAEDLGHKFTVLDLGGGFSGDSNCYGLFNKICFYINTSLKEYFPDDSNVHIIAEPGCYFACSAFTLCTTIVGKRRIAVHGVDQTTEKIMYYLNDGTYGSFPNLFQYYGVRMNVLLSPSEQQHRSIKTSQLWGCTCCSTDCIIENCELPEMEIGEHIIFENMGAYTLSLASTFNGFLKPKVKYVFGNVRKTNKVKSQRELSKSLKHHDWDAFIDKERCTINEEDDSNVDLRSFG